MRISAMHKSTRLALAGAVIGFSLGGFFDGILLHQVLQWHHLFSLVAGPAWRDIRMQILMDGWFHVLHFCIALAGLWLLWRSRGELSGRNAGRRLLGAALLGFSCWQFVDVVVFHWILVIHRIRVGVPYPLAYDLGWLALFGVSTLLAGMWLRLGAGGPGPGGGGAAVALGVVTVLAAPWAAEPPPGSHMVVVFRRGVSVEAAFAAAASINARVVWADASSGIVALDGGSAWEAWRLYRRGALLVGAGPFAAGCVGWIRS